MKKNCLSSSCAIAVGLLLVVGCSTDDASGFADAGEDTAAPVGEDTGAPVKLGNPDATVPSEDSGTPDAGSDAADASIEDAATHGDSSTPPKPDAGHVPDAGHDSGGTLDAAIDGSADAWSDDAATPDGSTDAATDSSTIVADDGGDAAALPPVLGAWNFDEGTGTSSADLSGNNHPAVFVGGASWGTGKEKTGLTLDGSTGYADLGVTLIDTTASFTVMSWVNLAVVGTWQVAVSEDDANGSLFGLKLRGDGSDEYDFDTETSDALSPGFAVAQSTTTATASTWVHLAGVYDPTGGAGKGTVTLYVNGAQEASTVVGQPLLAATGHFLIGRGLYNDVTGSMLDGTIDEVAVYGGVLTGAQVATIYTAQK